MTETPMAQLAKMYKLIEEHLRREELSMHALREKPDVKAAEKTNWQVRDIFRTLTKHDCLIKRGSGKSTTYRWNPDAPPFTLDLKAKQKGMRQAGPVAVVKPLPVVAPPKQMEIEFGGVILTLGTNPNTGLFRIIVDQKQ